jgi:hypothetical protein
MVRNQLCLPKTPAPGAKATEPLLWPHLQTWNAGIPKTTLRLRVPPIAVMSTAQLDRC